MSGADQYRINWGLTSGSMTSNATVNAPDTDYIIPDLDPDTEYFFTVTAINSVDEGPASDVWNRTTDSLPPPNPPTLITYNILRTFERGRKKKISSQILQLFLNFKVFSYFYSDSSIFYY